ncbi:MAG: OB-fold nucleic acid binding domain-containing protein, partial [Planctomycetota bacterium]|nr:OB-fold nucleic acid binding domain-containing protein [Planctomycetota bacterium]
MSIEGLDAKTYELRIGKLAKLREKGIDPFGSRFNEKRISVSTARSLVDEEAEKTARIAGRVSAIRMHGKSAFLDVSDITGKIQVYLRLNDIGAENYEVVKMLDVGDIIGVEGKVGKTSTGEVTLFATHFVLLCKTLLTPPEKWHGLKDVELRYRRRYVDLFSNPDVRQNFLKRTQVIKRIRHILDELGFVEVETPIMQPVAGGAEALPFVTHHNALDMQLYLRIAPECYLKRLLVGGMGTVSYTHL